MPGTNLTRDEAAVRAALLDVERYDVVLDLTTGPNTFSTTTTVHFAARTPGAETWIDFVGDSVQAVTLNGLSLDPAAVFADSRIALAGLAADNELVVEATGRYTNSGEGMHRFVDPVDGEVYLYSQFEVPDSRRVYAVFEQPDLKATFAFTATVPEHWVVISNQPAPEPVPAGEGTATWAFEPTPRISSYITALCAGPYTVQWDRVQGRDHDIPLGIFARRSITEHVDYADLFDVTKTGILFFEREFDGPFPFAKYDQIFVPEYNAGAMENAGCVTITDVYVFRGQAPAPLVERRALTILHELAHMWFGDLVTMKWWDDLWLNESFAEWASSACQAEATDWTDAWTTFHSHEKTWAYQQDQQPDTHPVYADMRDLADVAVNFDGITYAKGGSVLKQLVAYVGRDAFTAGLRSYFRLHAWGNTTMRDLFAEFESTSGRDLSDWAQRWLRTAGPSTLALEVESDVQGIITAAAMIQTAPPEHPTLRPHRLSIGRYDLAGGVLSCVGRTEVDIDGPRTELPALVGMPRPDLLLPNDGDLTYARIRLDDGSLQTALAHIAELDDSLARSLILGSLWELVRDGHLAPAPFVEVLLRIIPVEEHSVVLRTILQTTKQIPSMLLASLRWFLPEAQRPPMRARAVEVIRTALEAAVPGSDKQQQLVIAYAALATEPADLARLRGILDGSVIEPGLSVDQDLRWSVLTQLSAAGGVSAVDIAAELIRDPSAAGRELALQARGAMPAPEAKQEAWAMAIDSDTQTNAAMEHLGQGFRRCDDPQVLRPFVERYHDMLLPVFNSRSYAIAERCVKYFYPLDIADAALRDHTRRWLLEHEDAPAGLRRLVIEQLGYVETAVAAQEVQQGLAAATGAGAP
ncbi:MAG: aminopeptidase N [Candidatus Phosphoribacter sp.]